MDGDARNILLARLQISVSTSTFRWTECYRVNIALLDQQHQQMIDTVNELDQALRTGEGKSVVDAVLDKLVEYALVHFTAEERLMQQHDFPGLSTHQMQHEMFRQKIGTYLEDQKAGKPGVLVSPLFMQEWMKQHLFNDRPAIERFSECAGCALTGPQVRLVFPAFQVCVRGGGFLHVLHHLRPVVLV
jgi:hemerythrin